MPDTWKDANADQPPTDSEIDAHVRKVHLERYPDGCGETLALCCDDCVTRFSDALEAAIAKAAGRS